MAWRFVEEDRHSGRCRRCGYDLIAHGVGQRCPECGKRIKGIRKRIYDPLAYRTFDEEAMAFFSSGDWYRVDSWVGVLAVLLMIAVCCGSCLFLSP